MNTGENWRRERFSGQVTTDQFDPTPRDFTFGAVGGMSGRPAITDTGECCGLISTSIGGDDGPTYLSLLWPILIIPFRPIWPPGVYPKPVTLKSLSKARLATIAESFRVGTICLHEWIDPQIQFELEGHMAIRAA